MSDTTATPRPLPTIFLSDADVAALSDWPAAVAALTEAYGRPVAAAMVPPRSMARGDGIWLRSLTAVSPAGGHMGCKLIAASPKARRASYLIALFDQDTMALTALIDGNRVTGLRTAATAAVAVDTLAPTRPLQVGVIGAGFEARGALDCLRSVRPLAEVLVFSPTPTSRERFAGLFRPDLAIRAVDSAREAVEGADVVLCAARSRDESAVLSAEWLAPGATVVSLGSTLPEQRELDVATLARAALIVADMPEEVLHDTGDALAACASGVDLAGKTVSLNRLLAERLSARAAASDLVVYKSVGSALQDVVMAEALLAKARLVGLGSPLHTSILPVAK